MRTASEFNRYYQAPDPWNIRKASGHDHALARIIAPYVAGRRVLELGCGEGHLTATVFSSASQIKGVDISSIAVSRAVALSLTNASFEAADFLDVSFVGYDVIAAIECIYYLTTEQQDAFYRKLAHAHAGKVFILSGPIIGSNQHRTYFTHQGLVETFARYGFSLLRWSNLNVYRQAGLAATAAAALCRLPFCAGMVSFMPESVIYQRCYAVRC